MSTGSFTGFRLIHNDQKLIAFELPFPNEKMNLIKKMFEGQRMVIEYYDAKIKVYSAPSHFDSIIRALSVF
jgi:hypothetical protein